MPFRSTVCGELHHDLPDIGADKPDQWWDVAEEERSRRIKLTSDTCVTDGEYFFIRGVIELPIHDYPHRFGFGVWVSQKPENSLTYLQNPDSAEIGPFLAGYVPESAITRKTRSSSRQWLTSVAMAFFRGSSWSRPIIR